MTNDNEFQPPPAPQEPASPRWEPEGPIGAYVWTLKELLTNPTRFFRALRLPVNLAFALVFALVTHWIGSALEYLWTLGLTRTMNTETTEWREIFRKLMDQVDSTDRVQALSEIQEKAMHWVLGAGSVMLDPFKTCIKILLQSLALWVAARIFVPRAGLSAEQALSYRTSVTIVCFAMAPSILAGVPFVGSMISFVFTAILMIIGAKELYRVTPGRAALIVFFPQLVLLAVVVFVVAVLGVALMKLLFNFVGA